MYKNLKWRTLLIIVVVLGAVALAYPLKEKIALGLDLQGGMHLVLEVKVEKAVEASLERLADDIKRDIGEEDLEVDRIKAIFETLQINIRMIDEVDLPPVKKVMDGYAFFKLISESTDPLLPPWPLSVHQLKPKVNNPYQTDEPQGSHNHRPPIFVEAPGRYF